MGRKQGHKTLSRGPERKQHKVDLLPLKHISSSNIKSISPFYMFTILKWDLFEYKKDIYFNYSGFLLWIPSIGSKVDYFLFFLALKLGFSLLIFLLVFQRFPEEKHLEMGLMETIWICLRNILYPFFHISVHSNSKPISWCCSLRVTSQ